MTRFGLIVLMTVVSLSVSRGDDAARARKVRVALALSAGAKVQPAKKDAPTARGVRPVKLDWNISTEIEVAPPPKVATPAKKPARAVPAPDAKPMPPGMVFRNTSYRDVLARVEKGDKVVMLVRQPQSMTVPARLGYTTLRCDDAPVEPGRYVCFLQDGKPVMEEVKPVAAVPFPSTPTIPVIGVGRASTSSNGFYPMGGMYTLAPPVGFPGFTNCGPVG